MLLGTACNKSGEYISLYSVALPKLNPASVVCLSIISLTFTLYCYVHFVPISLPHDCLGQNLEISFFQNDVRLAGYMVAFKENVDE
jgi:hypothetical protein